MKTLLKIAIAVSAGAVVGAALGLLLAPAAGHNTIHKMNKRVRKFTRDTVDKLQDAMKCDCLECKVSKVIKHAVNEAV